ncbi:MAG TPA: hypothetical protein VFV90_07965 [Usitatibacter sp.]|nr:hypothetical protein [Usitatibacter sp.]
MLRLLGALGIGAAAMFFFDPENGRRRRALARDKFTRYQKDLATYAEGTAQDLRDRAQGIAAEARGMVERRLSPRRPASPVDIDLSQSER